jgi:hypothetical protein
LPVIREILVLTGIIRSEMWIRSSSPIALSIHFSYLDCNSTKYAYFFQGDFYYLGLEEKKLVLQIYTGGITYCRIESQLEYNDNKWHLVLADRIDRDGISHVLPHQILAVVSNIYNYTYFY